jgi:G3E family GTPase
MDRELRVRKDSDLSARLPDPATLALAREPLIPVGVLTGFLGSGKTTLIRSLLRQPAFEGTAVVVNEFGEIGLDHLLVEAAVSEDTVLLEGGCLCCATRGDLVRALRSLLDRRQRAELPPYRRVIVETSGLADPAPILQTLMSDPLRLSRYRLASLTATLDAVLGAETLARYGEARRQAALADRVVLTKADLADESQKAAAVTAVRQFSAAPIVLASDIVTSEAGAGLFSSASSGVGFGQFHEHHTHGAYASVARSLDRPLAWPRVEAWLAATVERCGSRLLRFKAVLAIESEQAPVALHAVQHVIHRPERLAAWPAGLAQGRIVLIAEGLSPAALDSMLDELTA